MRELSLIHIYRLSFFKELIDAKVMAPDWFTKNWDQACSDMANYQVGMAWFPALSLIHISLLLLHRVELLSKLKEYLMKSQKKLCA